jgi:hypothetical protein
VDIAGVGRVLAVLDWKSGKALYPEAFLQNAAYVKAMQRPGEPLLHGLLVRLPKVETDPEFEVRHIPAEQMDDLFTVFLRALDLWRWQQTMTVPR